MSEESDNIGHSISDRADDLNRRFHGPRNGGGICYRCNNAMIMRRKGEYEPKVYCDQMASTYGMVQVATDIEECTKFSQVGKLGIWELAKLARIIDSDKKDERGHYL